MNESVCESVLPNGAGSQCMENKENLATILKQKGIGIRIRVLAMQRKYPPIKVLLLEFLFHVFMKSTSVVAEPTLPFMLKLLKTLSF